jgi:hypothetical protein
MLKSEQNTTEVREQIEKLAKEKFQGFTTNIFFEHGHWWLKAWNDESESTYDVVDVEINAEDTLDFELLEENEL